MGGDEKPEQLAKSVAKAFGGRDVDRNLGLGTAKGQTNLDTIYSVV